MSYSVVIDKVIKYMHQKLKIMSIKTNEQKSLKPLKKPKYVNGIFCKKYFRIQTQDEIGTTC